VGGHSKIGHHLVQSRCQVDGPPEINFLAGQRRRAKNHRSHVKGPLPARNASTSEPGPARVFCATSANNPLRQQNTRSVLRPPRIPVDRQSANPSESRHVLVLAGQQTFAPSGVARDRHANLFVCACLCHVAIGNARFNSEYSFCTETGRRAACPLGSRSPLRFRPQAVSLLQPGRRRIGCRRVTSSAARPCQSSIWAHRSLRVLRRAGHSPSSCGTYSWPRLGHEIDKRSDVIRCSSPRQ